MNIGMDVSFYILVFFGCIPRGRIVGSFCDSSFLRNLHTVLHSNVPIHIPINSVGGKSQLKWSWRPEVRVLIHCMLINYRRLQKSVNYRPHQEEFSLSSNKSSKWVVLHLSKTLFFFQCQSVQSLSHVRLFATQWTAAHQTSLSITNCWILLKLMFIELVMPSHPLWSPSPPPSIFPSIRIFSNESVLLIRWQNYWSFSFNISPSSEYSGLVLFRIEWLDLLKVQGTPKSLLQHHSSKASILWCSVFFMVQLSHPYKTTGKTIAFTRWTFSVISFKTTPSNFHFFVNKVMLLSFLSQICLQFLLQHVYPKLQFSAILR